MSEDEQKTRKPINREERKNPLLVDGLKLYSRVSKKA